MSFKDAQTAICNAVTSWEGVAQRPHRFGAIAFFRANRELGHIHGDGLVDIPFPRDVRDQLVGGGEAQPHHILPRSGWVSVPLHCAEDVTRAIKLLRRSYDRRP